MGERVPQHLMILVPKGTKCDLMTMSELLAWVHPKEKILDFIWELYERMEHRRQAFEYLWPINSMSKRWPECSLNALYRYARDLGESYEQYMRSYFTIQMEMELEANREMDDVWEGMRSISIYDRSPVFELPPAVVKQIAEFLCPRNGGKGKGPMWKYQRVLMPKGEEMKEMSMDEFLLWLYPTPAVAIVLNDIERWLGQRAQAQGQFLNLAMVANHFGVRDRKGKAVYEYALKMTAQAYMYSGVV